MNTFGKVAVLLALACAVGVTLAMKQKNSGSPAPGEQKAQVAARAEEPKAAEEGPAQAAVTKPAATARLPRLVDLGAGKCIPCKMMFPVLDELKKEHAGRLEVTFIDVWENPKAGETYGIQMIPTQIFYDASGKELFRHEGFFPKAEILAKWKELGIDLAAPATSPVGV
jgi:thioredoxin 1